MTKRLLTLSLLIGSISCFAFNVMAKDAIRLGLPKYVNAFRTTLYPSDFQILVPTVIEFPLPEVTDYPDLVVAWDITDSVMVSSDIRTESKMDRIVLSAATSGNVNGLVSNMVDQNALTYTEFPLVENTEGLAEIILTSDVPLTASSISFQFDKNVSMPTEIELFALMPDGLKTVVARRSMNALYTVFPETTANTWVVNLSYSQPLRITNIVINPSREQYQVKRFVRFLAKPNAQYQVFYDADRPVTIPWVERGDLLGSSNVLKVMPDRVMENPSYVIADSDDDGIPDEEDNCSNIANPAQEDVDNNGTGDACDDFDGDYIITVKDNCPEKPNRQQVDTDADGAGDACDPKDDRFTEQYAWIPWVGIGVAALVLVTLFGLTLRSMKVKQ